MATGELDPVDLERRLYAIAGLQAQFRPYRGVRHEVTPEMWSDIEAAFRAALTMP